MVVDRFENITGAAYRKWAINRGASEIGTLCTFLKNGHSMPIRMPSLNLSWGAKGPYRISPGGRFDLVVPGCTQARVAQVSRIQYLGGGTHFQPHPHGCIRSQ